MADGDAGGGDGFLGGTVVDDDRSVGVGIPGPQRVEMIAGDLIDA
jgi:hypothetical protein